MKAPSPSVGRVVRYVMPLDSAHVGELRPAIIVRVWNDLDAPVHPGKCNLSLFLDGPGDFQEAVWRGQVLYDPKGTTGTWHWPTDPASGEEG